MRKRGQTVFGMSYSVIFGIFVIIAILGVGFYAISYFLNLNKCTQVGFFYTDFQDEVDRAWNSGKHEAFFTGDIPQKGLLRNEISHVCFGYLTSSSVNSADDEIFDELGKMNPSPDANVFIYPTKEACDGGLYYSVIDHVEFEGGEFFCKPVENEKVKVKLTKKTTDTLVVIGKS
jgi:hypothetical protein